MRQSERIRLTSINLLAEEPGNSETNWSCRDWLAAISITSVPGRRGWNDHLLVPRRITERRHDFYRVCVRSDRSEASTNPADLDADLPAQDVRRKRRTGQVHPPRTDAHEAAFRARRPHGTATRALMELIAWTGAKVVFAKRGRWSWSKVGPAHMMLRPGPDISRLPRSRTTPRNSTGAARERERPGNANWTHQRVVGSRPRKVMKTLISSGMVVTPDGFEPSTCRLGGGRSIP
jgi:hypothetical protein